MARRSRRVTPTYRAREGDGSAWEFHSDEAGFFGKRVERGDRQLGKERTPYFDTREELLEYLIQETEGTATETGIDAFGDTLLAEAVAPRRRRTRQRVTTKWKRPRGNPGETEQIVESLTEGLGPLVRDDILDDREAEHLARNQAQMLIWDFDCKRIEEENPGEPRGDIREGRPNPLIESDDPGWYSLYIETPTGEVVAFSVAATTDGWTISPLNIPGCREWMDAPTLDEAVGYAYTMVWDDISTPQAKMDMQAARVFEEKLEKRLKVDPETLNPSGPGINRAEDIFTQFHARDPKNVGKFPFEVPSSIYHVGPCQWVTYRSDKWNDGTHDYVHEITSFPRVKCCLVKLEGLSGNRIAVPKKIQGTQTLTQIGLKSLGIGFVDDDGQEMEISTPNSAWYWSSKGKALLCVQKKRRLVAIIWGGKLDVEPRGIVG
jgi:hypothetical protein